MVTQPWTCPTCNGTLSTPYCPACGESPPSARDLTLRGLFRQLFHAFSSIDGRLIRSFRCLVTRSGGLTVAYVQGRRMTYLGPFQLLLVANVLFFAMQSLAKANIVSSTLDSHLHNQDWHTVAQRLVSPGDSVACPVLSEPAAVCCPRGVFAPFLCEGCEPGDQGLGSRPGRRRHLDGLSIRAFSAHLVYDVAGGAQRRRTIL